MNDRKFELNPYFKKRDLSEKKIAFNQRLPKPIVDDLMQYFKDNQWNQTDGMTYVALDFLNNHCFERKEFDYNVIFILRKDHDLTSADMTAIGYVDKYKQFDDYKKIIDEDERQKYIELSGNAYANNNYLYALPIMESADYFTNTLDFKSDEDGFLYFNGYADYLHGRKPKTIDDILYILGHDFAILDKENPEKSFMPLKQGHMLHGLKVISLDLNNFLDKKSGGFYKSTVGFKHENFHRGIGVLQGADDLYFITYVWHFIPSPYGNQVAINYLEFHTKDEWFDIVMHSTNEDLKDFVLDLDEFKKIGKENVTKELDDINRQIKKLEQRKRECEYIIDNIIDENTLSNKLD